jgi:hypothetical protein
MAANGDVMSLEQAINQIPGVVSASVEWNGSVIVGVRVELEEGADEQAIGAMVGELLDEHGYRSRVAPEKVRVEPEVAPLPPISAERSGTRTGGATAAEVDDARRTWNRTLRSVLVDEDIAGVSVTVTDSGGAAATKPAGMTQAGRRTAIAAAVAELLGQGGSPPRVVETVERDQGVVLVVLEDRLGAIRAGTAVVRSGFDFAFAAAVWSALSS